MSTKVLNRLGGVAMQLFISKYIGSKDFYRKTLVVALPLALQLLLASCMSIVDMMMVASIDMVSAVGNASQMLILNDGISWGIVSGIAMFAAQFNGGKQANNLKKTFGLGIMMGLIASSFWVIIAWLFGSEILYFYLPDQEVLVHSVSYLNIAILSTLPFAINNSFTALFRSMHQTKITLYISIVGAISNVLLNSLFIFGFEMGVAGAALGTLLSQIIVLFIYVIYSVKSKQIFIGTMSEMFKLDNKFVKPIIKKMTPLMINETFFGFGMTLFVKAFGALGTDGMDAYYIANQIFNLFLFVVHGYGGAVSILIGTRLGQGRLELARKESNYQLFLGACLACLMIVIMVVLAKPLLALFFITDIAVYNLALGCLYVLGIKVLFRMFNYIMFSTLNAGGDSKILNILDSGLMYTVGLPLAFISVHWFKMESIVFVLLIVQIEQLVRVVFTYRRYKSYKWVQDLTKLVQ